MPLKKSSMEKDAVPLNGAAGYDIVRRALEHLAAQKGRPAERAAVAAHLGLSSAQFQKKIECWAGLPSEDFFVSAAPEAMRAKLRANAAVLENADETNPDALSRDFYVSYESMPPEDDRRRGAGLKLAYGFHDSPFGEALAIVAPQGLAGLCWTDPGRSRAAALADMTRRWPLAEYTERPDETRPYAARSFDPTLWRAERPLRLYLIGGAFEMRVWEMLLRIPMGALATYSEIARALGQPKAARAVGGAVGRNPVSVIVPCHRVCGKSGALTGYHWGLARKQAILAWEAGRLRARA